MIPTNAKVITRNGYTLIYQKNEANRQSKKTEFAIGFKGGAQYDGKYTGLTHLIEHLFYNSGYKKEDERIRQDFEKYYINLNGFTGMNFVNFYAIETNDVLEHSFDKAFGYIMNKKFTKERIDKEANNLAYEISQAKASDYVKDESGLYFDLLESLWDRLKISGEDFQTEYYKSLGDSNIMKKYITPEIIKEYKEKYFNRENLVISVVTNIPLKEIEELCDKMAEKHVPFATNKEYITKIEPVACDRKNIAIKRPTPYNSNITIKVVLRERTMASLAPAFEKAVDMIEDEYLNQVHLFLFQKFRDGKNQLAYQILMSPITLGESKFKIFTIVTSKNKYQKALKVLMSEVIGEIARKGISRKDFNLIKEKLVRNIDADKACPCLNATAVMRYYCQGIPFVKYDDILNELRNMEYSEFNYYLKLVYGMCNVSYTIDGDIKTKECPSVIDLQHMAGINKETDKTDEDALNYTIIETLPLYNQNIFEHEGKLWEQLDQIYQGIQLDNKKKSATSNKEFAQEDGELCLKYYNDEIIENNIQSKPIVGNEEEHDA
jgi:predicted Zn-dependent peptidase